MIVTALVTTNVMLCLPAVAQEQEMPKYDPEAYCHKVASFGGSLSETMLGACMDQEQAAYDALKPQWPQVADHVRAYCDKVARFGGDGSYTMLGACIQQENEAGQSNQNRKFKF
jgi:hypothetical protein